MKYVETKRGLRHAKIGLGTWPMLGSECRDAVLQALDIGYRHIDTAAAYKNQDAIGEALVQTALPRHALHVTSKIWFDQLSPAAMRASAAQSLEQLQTDYVDLLYIHWPSATEDMGKALETLAQLKQEGVARHVGVANFPLALLRWAVEEVQAPIEALQVEYHVLLDQTRLIDYCRQHDIVFAAYSPLARNRISDYPLLQEIAAKHGATPAQVALNYLVRQDGVAAVPKSASRENQEGNLRALDLQLDTSDLAQIDALPKDIRLVNPEQSPKWD